MLYFKKLQETVQTFPAAISFGNIIGIAAGQIAGDIILNKNTAQIIPAMDESRKHMLMTHYGVPIWLAMILTVFILSVAGTKQFHRFVQNI